MTTKPHDAVTSDSARLSRRDLAIRCRDHAVAAFVGSSALAYFARSAAAQKEVLPKHITPETLRAVVKALEFLSAKQSDDGSWIMGGGEAYPDAIPALAGAALLA